MPDTPRRAMTYAEMITALNARNASAEKRSEMIARSQAYGPNDEQVVAYARESAAALRSTKSGRLAASIGEAIVPVLGEIIGTLEKRIRELEARPVPKWSGPFKQGTAYAQMSFVVDRGALWIAKSDTTERPGNSTAWTLCCKSGSHNGR